MIVIMGDSWGVGEWDYNSALSGPGIGQYFSLHGKVINLSEGGADNFMQLTEFTRFLAKFVITSDDIFYWIVSDPLRHISPAALLNTSNNINHSTIAQLHNFLEQVNSIAVFYKITVNLIGGLCDLDSNVNYSNLKVVVPSWCKLLSPQHVCSIYTLDTIKNLSGYVNSVRPDLKEEWIDITNQVLQKQKSYDQLVNLNLMQADHPTRLAHRMLRDYLAPDYAYKI